MEINPYHSALSNPIDINVELHRWEALKSVVFEYDISLGCHPDFYGVDAIYSEPSWRAGYSKFMDRAGYTGNSSFEKYLDGISHTICSLQVPTYIVLGKHMVKFLKPMHIMPVKLNGGNSLIGVWNVKLPSAKTNVDVLFMISDTYSRVLDFCCGYGNTIHAMLKKEKTFVCSDINKKCVFYTAKRYMGYHD